MPRFRREGGELYLSPIGNGEGEGPGELNSLLLLSSVGYPELPHAVPEGAVIDTQQLRGPGHQPEENK